MKSSETIKEVMTAIQNVQQSVPPLQRVAKGSTGGRNYGYTPIDYIWEKISAALQTNSLAITQAPTVGDGNTVADELFKTTIYHVESGEWISETMRMRTIKDDPQSIGSAITYYRRYMLVSMLGLVVKGDDNDASEHKLASASQKAKIIGAVKQIFPDLESQQDIIATIQNIVGKHPSYIREDEADDALNLIKAFTAKEVDGE
jgi:hypothetical protein